jgi:transcriptional regulator with XRE-family HTH domain
MLLSAGDEFLGLDGCEGLVPGALVSDVADQLRSLPLCWDDVFAHRVLLASSMRLDITSDLDRSKMKYLMSDKLSITAQQSRGARAMLGWTREQLAERSKVSAATLADFEAEKRTPYDRTLADIRHALEAAGIAFIPGNGGGPGVRLRDPVTAAARATRAPKPAASTKPTPRKKPRQRGGKA